MKFKTDYLLNYLKEAPLSLAIIRCFECEILSGQSFNKPVLDLGCGDGIFSWVLFDEQIETGIDLNPKELENAEKYGMHKELILCSAEQIPKASEYFHTIFGNSVLEHIPDIKGVLKEVKRLLAKDGHFYVTVPTDFSEQYSIVNVLLIKLRMKKYSLRYRKFHNSFWKHYHCCSIDQWEELFVESGFKLKQTINYYPKSIAMLDDLFILSAFPSWLTKKICNRWFILKNIRKMIVKIYVKFITIDFRINNSLQNGGLVFFDLTKE
jgi:ubiquinone/menaquinone biosynthesis C-methylase UbiE